MNPTHSRIPWPVLALALAAVLLRILAAARRRPAAVVHGQAYPAAGERARLAETGERCTVLRHLAEVRIDGLTDPTTVPLADLERDRPADSADRGTGVQLAALEVGGEVWFRPMPGTGVARVGTVTGIDQTAGTVAVREQSGRTLNIMAAEVITGDDTTQDPSATAGTRPGIREHGDPAEVDASTGHRICRRCGRSWPVTDRTSPAGFGPGWEPLRCSPECKPHMSGTR